MCTCARDDDDDDDDAHSLRTAGWEPVNVREFERHAQLMLSKNAFDYYASGANDMVTLRENRWDCRLTRFFAAAGGGGEMSNF